MKNNRFFKILIFKINQTEIKNNQNILWPAILCFGKPLKNDCINLYFKMDKLSKKDCFKRFERVFARNLSIQTRLQRYKVKKIQEFKITKF